MSAIGPGYRLRKQPPEPVFGQIKQARGFRQFLLRGFEKVRAEWAIVCTDPRNATKDCRYCFDGRLLWHDVLPLEVPVGPPGGAVAIEPHRLRKELVAIPCQRVDGDGSGLDRPEASAAGFIAKIGAAICGAGENALPWLDYLQASV